MPITYRMKVSNIYSSRALTQKKIYTNFFEKFTGWDTNDNNLMKKFIFVGLMPDNPTLNFFVLTVSTHINFYIWQCKLQKKLPVQTGLYNEIFYKILGPFALDYVMICI
jgi:hypothetical protein